MVLAAAGVIPTPPRSFRSIPIYRKYLRILILGGWLIPNKCAKVIIGLFGTLCDGTDALLTVHVARVGTIIVGDAARLAENIRGHLHSVV